MTPVRLRFLKMIRGPSTVDKSPGNYPDMVVDAQLGFERGWNPGDVRDFELVSPGVYFKKLSYHPDCTFVWGPDVVEVVVPNIRNDASTMTYEEGMYLRDVIKHCQKIKDMRRRQKKGLRPIPKYASPKTPRFKVPKGQEDLFRRLADADLITLTPDGAAVTATGCKALHETWPLGPCTWYPE